MSLAALEAGGIAVVFATVTPGFLLADVGEDFEPRSALYQTAEQAQNQALAQIGLYERWEKQGRVRLLKSVSDLDHHLQLWQQDRRPGLVLLMESADPIVEVSDLPLWWQRGLRMIGLTYGDTRYGTGFLPDQNHHLSRTQFRHDSNRRRLPNVPAEVARGRQV